MFGYVGNYEVGIDNSMVVIKDLHLCGMDYKHALCIITSLYN